MQQKPKLPQELWRVLIYKLHELPHGQSSRCYVNKKGQVFMAYSGRIPNHIVFIDDEGNNWVRNDYGLFKVDDEPIDQGQGLEGWFSSEKEAEARLFKHLPKRPSRNPYRH